MSDRVRPSPLSMLPDPSQPSSVTTYNNLQLFIPRGQFSPGHLALPPSSGTHLAVCWTASRGRGRTYAGRSYTGDFIIGHAGHPTASASFRSPSAKGIASISKAGSQVTELLPPVLQASETRSASGPPLSHSRPQKHPGAHALPCHKSSSSDGGYLSLVCHQGRRLEQGCTLGSKGKLVRQKACSRDLFSFGSLFQAQHYPL